MYTLINCWYYNITIGIDKFWLQSDNIIISDFLILLHMKQMTIVYFSSSTIFAAERLQLVPIN